MDIHMFFSSMSGAGAFKSNAFAFKRKYGKYPVVGMEVQCKVDENGFWVIDF